MRKPIDDLPEKLKYTKYYEHDGALRAYANRAMVMAGPVRPDRADVAGASPSTSACSRRP